MLGRSDCTAPPEAMSSCRASRGLSVVAVTDADDMMARALRGRPRLVVFDARVDAAAVEAACSRLKSDSFTGIVPAVLVGNSAPEALASGFGSGADEAATETLARDEPLLRMDALLRRADRDVQV